MSARDQKTDEDWILGTLGAAAAPIIASSHRAWGAMSEAQKADHLEALHAIEADFARAMRDGADPSDNALASVVARHRDWVAASWGKAPGDEAYAGLADLYEAHPDFASRYEAIAPGFTTFLTTAMRAHSGLLDASG